MPIIPSFETRRLTQDQFSEIAYDVMNHIFSIHNEDKVCRAAEVIGSKNNVGSHNLEFLSETEVFWLTAFPELDSRFESHAQRLLKHISTVDTIQWANIADKIITFSTITR